MIITPASIKGLFVVQPKIIKDNRGFLFESYDFKTMQNAGLKLDFVQDNHSMSKQGVLRGMHFQKKFPQGKLVRCVRGKIWDAVVDLRKNSKTFGSWFGLELTAENKKLLYIPENFAHGFLVLSKEAEVCFKVSSHYHPGDEIGFAWNDPEVGIEWPAIAEMIIIFAEKDKGLKSLRDTLQSISF